MTSLITLLTIWWGVALGLFAVSATLQVIGYNDNISPRLDEMLSKLSHILNTFAMMIVVIGLLSVVVG